MNRQTIRQLSKLAALCTASTLGYTVAAESVRNRGLKIILHSYAVERASFAAQLGDEIERLDGQASRQRNPLAALHRGWINLKATMAIGAENSQSIVLDEVARGERRAGKGFQAALQAELPIETHQLVEQFAQRVQVVQQHIDQLRGASGEQQVVRLADDPGDVAQAIAELKAAGFAADQIDVRSAATLIDQSQRVAPHSTVRETVAATALLAGIGGALLGVVMAILSLATQEFPPGSQSIAVATAIGWPLIGALVGVLFGAIVGGMLGQGISEQDSFFMADSVAHGNSLVTVTCDPDRARQASDILYRVNVAARSSRPAESLPARATAA